MLLWCARGGWLRGGAGATWKRRFTGWRADRRLTTRIEVESEGGRVEEVEGWYPRYIDLVSISERLVAGRFHAVVRRCREVLKSYEGDVENCMRGRCMREGVDQDQLKKELVQVCCFMSDAYMNLSKKEKALEAAETAALILPSFSTYYELADHNLLVGRYERALSSVNKAIRLAPPSEADSLVLKARILFELGRREDEEVPRLCDMTIARDPYAIDAFTLKAQWQAFHGRYTEAVRTLDRAIIRCGHVWYAVEYKVKYLMVLKKEGLAMKAMKRCVFENSDDEGVAWEGVMLAVRIGDWSSVVGLMEKIVVRFEKGRLDLCYAYIQAGDREKVVSALRSARESGEVEARLHDLDVEGLERLFASKASK
ncbi:uncharacterized protein LOC126313379 [Schistocerca gregaria]|uniref:uncharacterized protein LOC126313379 n=1 Tax=Schistocerca gregaria TaxID=7010 RepID=UPI00211E76B6|nr:uncharacterized protein LOC126313379 [Schistocerca gregaria]